MTGPAREIVVYADPVRLDFVRGDATRLMIPAHDEALREGGEGFLTEAFRAFGSLAADNRVTRIVRLERCAEGSTGMKLLLTLEYERAEPGLPTELFVKFSRDFADAFRDRRRGELETEIRLADLSRHPNFPIAVPRACFGDFHHESGTGLLITERIPFGEGGIEPLLHKCLDHKLSDPFGHYRAVIAALGRLAGAHRAGRLSPDAEALFPFDAQAALSEDLIPYSEAQIGELVARYAAFVAKHPQLMPAHLATPAFIAVLERDLLRLKRVEADLKRRLVADPDYIALGHFNANIDNAWFWRDASGDLQCGLFDWQRARQANVAYTIWGGLSAAGLEIWDDHLDELLEVFAAEMHAHGGPRLDPAVIRLHLTLHAAPTGLALLLLEAPSLVLRRLPAAAQATSPRDPIFETSEPARSFLQVFTVWLNLWKVLDVSATLDRVLGA